MSPIANQTSRPHWLHFRMAACIFGAGLAFYIPGVLLSVNAAAPANTAPPINLNHPEPAPAQPAAKPIQPKRRWYQLGHASWYGHSLQGQTTASGESFDMNQLTCAHRSLPMGTWIKITNLRNRKSVVARVNDRGPVPQDRVVDVSYAVAKLLGFSGVAKVSIEPAEPNASNASKAVSSYAAPSQPPSTIARLAYPALVAP